MAGRSAFAALQVPICRAGWPFIAGFLIVSVLLGLLWLPLLWVGLVLTLWCVYFFRDPRRVAPVDPALVLSPADGVVQATGLRPPPPELELGEVRCPA